jgi:hypothetical protein
VGFSSKLSPRCSGQRFAVQDEQTASCLLRLWFVINVRIRRATAMRRVGVNFNLRGHVCFGEGVFQNVFVIGRARIIIRRYGNEELRLAFGRLQMGTVGFVGHKSTAVEGCDCSDAFVDSGPLFGTRLGRPCNCTGYLFRFFATDGCPSGQVMNAFASVICVDALRVCASGLTWSIGVVRRRRQSGLSLCDRTGLQQPPNSRIGRDVCQSVETRAAVRNVRPMRTPGVGCTK